MNDDNVRAALGEPVSVFRHHPDCDHHKAKELVEQGHIRPVLWRTMGFEEVAEAHQLMRENRHLGRIAILVGAEQPGLGRTAEEPEAIYAEVGA